MAFEQARRADELLRLLEKYAPRLSLALREAWEQGRLSVALDRLEELLKAERVTEAVDLVLKGADPVFVSKSEDALRQVFLASAQWAWNKDKPPMPQTRVLRTLFDQLNPKTIEAMRQNELRMVQQVRQETKAGLKKLMEGALTDGINPREIARRIREEPGFGLTESQEATVQRYKAYLRKVHEKRSLKELGIGMERSLSVDEFGRPIDGINRWRLRDMRYDQMLERAQRNNKPLTETQIEKMATAYRRRFIKLRSENIARTEMTAAGANGSREAWRQMVESGLYPDGIRRFWFTAAQDRVCPRCKPMPRLNKEGRGLDEPFMDGNGNPVDFAPLHPGCRCVIYPRPVKRR
jgi:hypothetical protein